MAKHTLYHAQKFFIYLISSFGFNESNAILRVYNCVAKVFMFLLLKDIALVMGLAYCYKQEVGAMGEEVDKFRLFVASYFVANVSCFLLCHFRKRSFNVLLKVLKGYRASRKLSRRTRDWRIFFAFFVLFAYLIWLRRPTGRFTFYLLEVFHFLSTAFVLMLAYCLPLCALPVLINIHYIERTFSEKTEEIKKCKSPLRKARLTTRLILLSTGLKPLVKATDHYGAPLMFLLKTSAAMLTVLVVDDTLKSDLSMVISCLVNYFSPLLFFLIYLWYLRVAPSANQIPCMMARVMLENVLSDDQRMSREPISRVQLLRARWVHLAHLTHSTFDRDQFTVLGEPVDETDIFMVFVELIDNFNTYNSVF